LALEPELELVLEPVPELELGPELEQHNQSSLDFPAEQPIIARLPSSTTAIKDNSIFFFTSFPPCY